MRSLHRPIALLADIRFWVLVLVLVRLIGITNPPLETAHHWRQTTVAMVARNYHEHGIDLMYPRVDMAGERSGITGMEVPLLSAAIAVISGPFGYAHWYGRIIALLLCSAGLLAYHSLVRKYFSDETAFYSTLVLGVSLWFSYGRKIMPDVPSTSLVLIGLAFAAKALQGGRIRLLGPAAAFCMALGTAMKLPSGYLMVLLPAMVLFSPATKRDRWILMGLVCLFQLPVLWWYFSWAPHLDELGGYTHFFMGNGIGKGLQELLHAPIRVLDNFYFDALRFSGAALAVVGLVMAIARRERVLLMIVMLVSLSFFFVMLKAGAAFWKHAYYVVPFIPLLALLAGSALVRVSNWRWRVALLVLVATEGLANQWQDLRISPTQAPLLNLEAALDQLGDRGDLIIVNSGSIPTPLYFAHRKGWTCYRDDLARVGYIDSLTSLGAVWLVQVRKGYETNVPIMAPAAVITEDYAIFRVRP